jgi:methionine-gamma-lyase
MTKINDNVDFLRKMKLGTRCVRAGEGRNPFGAHATPIYQTSTYVFESIEHAEAIFSRAESGYSYIRAPPCTPTHAAFVEKICSLEQGEAGLAFSSGMAAETALVLSQLKGGDHLLSTDVIYGGTYGLFTTLLPRFGIEVSFVDTTDADAVSANLRKNTKMVFLETPANPTLSVCDLREICSIARDAAAISVVDNTFSSPFFQRPLELGADAVVESCTKYIGGHGDLLGGVVVGSLELIKTVRKAAVLAGGTMGTHEAWLCIRGLKTLHLRMERHACNAQKAAEFLEDHPKVEKVSYPGLPSHPQHEIAKKQMTGFGGMLSFWVKGGLLEARRFMKGLRLCSLAVSLGSVDTLIELPATLTHANIPREIREQLGITDNLVRVSVGVEDSEDILADLEGGLANI